MFSKVNVVDHFFSLCSGYMAPEYVMHGYLTDKADVYSFGIVALEILHGSNNTILRQKEEAFHLLDWVSILVLCSCQLCSRILT